MAKSVFLSLTTEAENIVFIPTVIGLQMEHNIAAFREKFLVINNLKPVKKALQDWHKQTVIRAKGIYI